MMTSGTKAKKHFVTLLLFLNVGLSSIYAQSDEAFAKSYFLKAQKAYSEGNNTTALAQLDKTLEYLGTTNAKIEALYVKTGIQQKDFINAKKHLSTYFEVADEGHSDYMEMLDYLTGLNEIMLQNLNFVDGLAKIETRTEEGYRSGFIDKSGEVAIPLKYGIARDFSENIEGLAVVRVNGKYGFIDKSGKIVIPLKYDYVYDPLENGLVKVKTNGKYGFLDKTGEEVAPIKYDYVYDPLENGLVKVEVNGKYGYIDKTGQEVIPIKYDYVTNFSEKVKGLAKVELNDKYGYIDKTGKVIIPIKYSSLVFYAFYDSVAHIEELKHIARVRINKKWGYINITGEVVVPIEFDENLIDTDSRPVKLIGIVDGESYYFDTSGNRIEE